MLDAKHEMLRTQRRKTTGMVNCSAKKSSGIRFKVPLEGLGRSRVEVNKEKSQVYVRMTSLWQGKEEIGRKVKE